MQMVKTIVRTIESMISQGWIPPESDKGNGDGSSLEIVPLEIIPLESDSLESDSLENENDGHDKDNSDGSS